MIRWLRRFFFSDDSSDLNPMPDRIMNLMLMLDSPNKRFLHLTYGDDMTSKVEMIMAGRVRVFMMWIPQSMTIIRFQINGQNVPLDRWGRMLAKKVSKEAEEHRKGKALR